MSKLTKICLDCGKDLLPDHVEPVCKDCEDKYEDDADIWGFEENGKGCGIEFGEGCNCGYVPSLRYVPKWSPEEIVAKFRKQ